jgi:ABC-type glycerol-3-phosphate transport system substrate-binding protein
MKRLLVLALALMLVLGVCPLQGCFAEEALPVVTYMGSWGTLTTSGIDPANTAVAQQWAKDCGVELQFVVVPSDVYNTKFTTWMAAGTLPDISAVGGDSPYDIVNEYGPKGAFLNISEHLDQMPGFSKLLDQNPYISKVLTMADGDMYGVPQLIYTYQHIMYTTPIIRRDLLEKVGYDINNIVTLEDLTEALRLLTEELGTAALLQRKGYGQMIQKMGLMFNTKNDMWWDYETNTYKFPSHSENMLKLITWMHQLYEEGIMHPDWAVMDDPTWEKMLADNKGAFCIDRMSLCGDLNFDPTFDFYPILYPLIDGVRYKQPIDPTVNAKKLRVINPNSKVLEKAIEVLDYQYNPDNALLFIAGPEGIGWEKGDQTAAGINWLVKIFGMNEDKPDAPHYLEVGIEQFNSVQTIDFVTTKTGKYPEYFQPQLDRIEANGGFAPEQPFLKFTNEELDIKKQLLTPMMTYCDENLIKFIEGDRPLSEWPDFQKEIEAMGLDQVQKIYDDALARWDAM